MSPAQVLDLIVEAQSELLMIEREVAANDRLFGRGVIVFATVLAGINARDAARERVTVLLTAAVAHREEWAHDLTSCPICQRDREEVRQ